MNFQTDDYKHFVKLVGREPNAPTMIEHYHTFNTQPQSSNQCSESVSLKFLKTILNPRNSCVQQEGLLAIWGHQAISGRLCIKWQLITIV